MKVLIAGGHGYFTSFLIERLAREGHETFLISGRQSLDAVLSKGRFIDYNFALSDENIGHIVTSIMPDAIVFLGAVDDNYAFDSYQKSSMDLVAGLTNMLLIADSLHIERFIYLSSCEVYGTGYGHNISELDPIAPVSTRALVLAEGEGIVGGFHQSGRLSTAVLRLGQVYGPLKHVGEMPNFAVRLFMDAYNGHDITAVPDAIFSPLYVTDAVDAIYKSLSYRQGEDYIFNVAGDSCRYDAFIQLILNQVDSDRRRQKEVEVARERFTQQMAVQAAQEEAEEQRREEEIASDIVIDRTAAQTDPDEHPPTEPLPSPDTAAFTLPAADDEDDDTDSNGHNELLPPPPTVTAFTQTDSGGHPPVAAAPPSDMAAFVLPAPDDEDDADSYGNGHNEPLLPPPPPPPADTLVGGFATSVRDTQSPAGPPSGFAIHTPHTTQPPYESEEHPVSAHDDYTAEPGGAPAAGQPPVDDTAFEAVDGASAPEGADELALGGFGEPQSDDEPRPYAGMYDPDADLLMHDEEDGTVAHDAYMSATVDGALTHETFGYRPIVAAKDGIERVSRFVRGNYDELQKRLRTPEDAPEEETIDRNLVREVLRKAAPFIENAAVFIVTLLVTLWSANVTYLSSVDFLLLYVTLVSITFGKQQAVLAILAASVFSIILQVNIAANTIGGFDYYHVVIRVMTLFVIGIITGHTRDRLRQAIADKDDEIDYLRAELKEIHEINESNIMIKQVLEERLVNYGDSLAKIYSIVSELDLLAPEKIMFAAIDVIARFMHSKDISMYLVSEQRRVCRLVATTSDQPLANQKSLFFDDISDIIEMMNRNDVYVNRQMLPGRPLLAAPVYSGNTMVALVMLWDMDFERISQYQVNLFSILCRLISSSVEKAYQYNEAARERRYIEGTSILKPEAFYEIYETHKEAKDRGETDFVVFEVVTAGRTIEELDDILVRQLRNNDFLGADNEDHLYILLSNTNTAESLFVKNRLHNHNIFVREATIT